MNVLEEEIEDIIYKMDPKKLTERGIPCTDQYMLRQVELGGYGRLDLLSFQYTSYKSLDITIWELKKGTVNIGALFQALRYCKGVENLIDHYCYINKDKIRFKINLVGKEFDTSNDFVYATDYFGNLNFYTYSIDTELGIRFEKQQGYKLTNTGVLKPSFPNPFEVARGLIKKSNDI